VGFRFPKSFLSWLELKVGAQTDSCDVVREMIIAARKGGRLALIGDYFANTNGYPIGAFMEKALTQTGGQLYCQRYWKQLLQRIVEGKLDATWEFTHKFNLQDIPQAYDVSCSYISSAGIRPSCRPSCIDWLPACAVLLSC
jgi:hypothetical protein